MSFESTDSGQDKDLRIVLVGKTGVGKSAGGNTILGKKVFKSQLSPSSLTSHCDKVEEEVNGRNVAVVDTPGLFDTKHSNDYIIGEIKKCICLSSPGPHVFLVVLHLGRFTKEEQDTVEIIQTTFGPESANYTMVLFTHGDQLEGTSIEEFIGDSKPLADVVRQCHGGCHVFDNKATNDHSQVTELLQKIDKMVQKNRGLCFTNELYKKAEAAIQAEIKNGKSRAEAERKNAFLKGALVVLSMVGGAGSGVGVAAVVGAAAGSVLGPVGTLVGAGVGAGVGALVGAGAGLVIHLSEKCTTQ